ncbi:PIG-L deacetylase family protein [Brevibacillus invocatus]|uniref:PIG-L deacetylase family protein n=1 Tax=Brevibacillus invocatus TaxID=173959 RepID=UPI00203E55AD|nr:PIG-L deacetylase family protein [Brevibacillus invocatus]MCM3079667.1 PIG-L family deacetylase [Brevibacillus invocatus]MCM3431123.1 PIG-L family deacetylase [Brevibacillus invocatus]
MNNVLVVAPHPDDETLGCGGTLLKHIENGDKVNWLIVTTMFPKVDKDRERLQTRETEIKTVSNMYGFSSVHHLGFETTRLDNIPMSDLVGSIGKIINEVRPEIIYLPYRGDVHTDHKMVFDAAVSCTKWFRYNFVKRILAYETLSETDFGINPDNNGFRPNVFVDISPFLNKKLDILRVFKSEMGDFPFPRSEQAVKSQSMLRGATAGCEAAEAFMLLKEIS